MATFKPWIGNFNPTEHGKNEYIRLLKEALLDESTFRIENGSYTGDGSIPRVISLTDPVLNPSFLIIGVDSGNVVINFLTGSVGSLLLRSGAAPLDLPNAVTAFAQGSFTVNDTTYTNTNSTVYYYLVLGS